MKKMVIILLIILIFPSYVFSEIEIINSVIEGQIEKTIDTKEIDTFLKDLVSDSEFKFDGSPKYMILGC